nr:carbohydrate kinase family protein [Candidatus Sigynarchaeota archaeon]
EIIPEYVAKAEIFHTDAVNVDSARKCMQIAKEAGKRVSFDLERHVAVYGLKAIKDLIEMTDILLPNRRGALELTKETDVKKAAKKLLSFGPEIVLITLGEEGSLLVTAKEEHRIPIYKVKKVVDTTGAGDAFCAGVLYRLFKELQETGPRNERGVTKDDLDRVLGRDKNHGDFLVECLKHGNAVAAFKVQSEGAQGNLPNVIQVNELVKSSY